MKNLLVLALLGLLISCKCVKQTSAAGFEEAARAYFGESAQIVYNDSRTHALVYTVNKPDMKTPVNALNFGIYDVANKALLYTEQKYSASVEWINDQFVMVKSSPGVQSSDEAVNSRMHLYYIEVNTRKKYTELPN